MMIKLTIDGTEVEVEDGTTVLQACEIAGREIPRFCYHERLSIAGNCRMCLVEIEPSTKPAASCAVSAADGMVVKTQSDLVTKARTGVMEFMLINHPLDCPICDQGGECDLQDQAMGYGTAESRYQEPKRAVENKHMGPLISTIMTRCIHCTRCVRFATEVAGVDDMGALGRGENMEITTYLEKALASELSGNVVDLCPVGALTSRPYAFNARSWELTHTESFDAMDAVGSAIRIDTRGNQVMRVLPRVNDDVNEEWISDKTRHALDGLLQQRLDRPYIRGRGGRLIEATWQEALGRAASKLKKAKPAAIGAIAGDQCDSESMYALMRLMQSLGCANIDCRQDGSVIGQWGRCGAIFNSSFNGIDEADYILLIGANPRHEAAIVNARIRRCWLDNGVEIGRIGMAVDLTYPVREFGADPSQIEAIAKGAHPAFNKLKKAKKPMIIIGAGALNRPDSKAILGHVSKIAQATGVVSGNSDGWNGFNILQTAASRVGGIDMGFLPSKGGMATKAMLKAIAADKLEVVYLLGADECVMDELGAIEASGRKTFIIYQGSHGDAGAQIADIVLPGAAWCEKDATFVNTEGRVQFAPRASFPPGDAREDWSILRALSDHLKKPLAFDSLEALRAQMVADFPLFGEYDEVSVAPFTPQGGSGKINNKPLIHGVGPGAGRGFYMTCPISRHSLTMAQCIRAFEMDDTSKIHQKDGEAAE